MAEGVKLTSKDVERLGPKAQAQVKDSTPLTAHQPRPAKSPPSRPKAAAPKALHSTPAKATPRPVTQQAGAFVERQTNKVDRKLGGALGKHGRAVLVAELVMAAFIVGISYVADNKTAPPPSKFIALFTVYLVLGFVSEFGPDAARFAAAFGGLFLLTLVMFHAKGILEVMAFVTGQSQPQGQIQSPAAPPPANSPPPAAPSDGRVPARRGPRGIVS